MTTVEAPGPLAELVLPAPAVEIGSPIKLIASVMVGANEVERYLVPCLEHIFEFCDLVCVRWESAPGVGHGAVDPKLRVLNADPSFYAHEGRARQELVDFTLAFDPTHILSIDADEFIADGALLRAHLESDLARDGLPKQPSAWSLCMQEIWNLRPDGTEIRMDGGWVEHEVPVVWTPGQAWHDDQSTASNLTMKDAALACGRIPQEVHGRRGDVCTAIMHFGWTARDERVARHARYVEHDGGRFHNIRHLDSILLPDEEIELWKEPWPAALGPFRKRIEAHAGVVVEPVPMPDIVLGPMVRFALGADLGMHGHCYVRVDSDGKGTRVNPEDVRS